MADGAHDALRKSGELLVVYLRVDNVGRAHLNKEAHPRRASLVGVRKNLNKTIANIFQKKQNMTYNLWSHTI